jgi:hypothetical protein
MGNPTLVRLKGARMTKITYLEPLTDTELEKITVNDLEALKVFYRILRTHHIEETTELWRRLEVLKPGTLAKLKTSKA